MKAYRKSEVPIMQNPKERTNLNTWETSTIVVAVPGNASSKSSRNLKHYVHDYMHMR